MKKINRFLAIILSAILSIAFCFACQAKQNKETDFILTMKVNNPVMTVNGVEQNIDDLETSPIVQNGRTLVPVRSIIEAMGGKVEWEQSSQTATLTYNSDTINLTIGSTIADFNGEKNTLDVSPVVINGRTMLPIRFIAESFKFDVDWQQETQTITIKKSVNLSEEIVSEESKTTDNKNVLVVYYSATGSTENVANYIANELGADIFEIKPVNPYTSADLNWNDENSRVSKEHNNENERVVELESTNVPNWEKYDTVFIGYPIWWGIAAWPVNGFVEANDFTGKTVIPFCTSASSGLGDSGKNLQELAGTGNWLDGQRFSSVASENDVKEWVKTF